LFFCGCESKTAIPVITQDDIFEIEEKEYYILFVKDDCSGCEKIKPNAFKYHKQSLFSSGWPKIYQVNVSDPINKAIIGDQDLIDGATSISKLKITRTPTLIIIKDGTIIEHYINSGNVGNFFEEALTK
jgi:thioredoxin-related protein